MRLFQERVKINPSYIYAIEKEGLLPSSEKLEALASVFVAVAKEQGAAQPEDDARLLFRERFVDRLGFDPDLAEVLVKLRALNAAQRADVIEPLSDSIEIFSTLDTQERRALARLLNRLVAALQTVEGRERREMAGALQAGAEQALTDFLKRHYEAADEDQHPPAGAPRIPEPHKPASASS